MPFIDLRLPDDAAAAAVAIRLAGAVAAALELDPGDVIVSATGSTCVVDGRGPVAGWPSAIIHGRDRGADARARVMAAASAVLASAMSVDADHVWVSWAA